MARTCSILMLAAVRFENVQVGMVAMVELAAGGTLAATGAGGAEQNPGHGQRQQALADPLRAGEQVGMRQAVAGKRPAQDILLTLMAENLGEDHGLSLPARKRSTIAFTRRVTTSMVPRASIMRKRVSRAANSR